MSCKGFCSFGRRLSKRKTHRKLTSYQKFMKKKLKEIYDKDRGINPKSAIRLAAKSWSKHKKGSKFGSPLSNMYENMTVKPFLSGNKFGSNTLQLLQNIKPSGKPIMLSSKYGRKRRTSRNKKHRFGSNTNTNAPGPGPTEMSVYQQYTGESPSQWKNHYESIPTNLKPNFYQNIPKDVPSNESN